MKPLYISCQLYSSDEYFYLLLAHLFQFTIFFLLYKFIILQARILTYSHKNYQEQLQTIFMNSTKQT